MCLSVSASVLPISSAPSTSSVYSSECLYEYHFRVEDTGIGISDDMKHRLFRNFSQVDAAHTRKYGGTGKTAGTTRTLIQSMSIQMSQ